MLKTILCIVEYLICFLLSFWLNRSTDAIITSVLDYLRLTADSDHANARILLDLLLAFNTVDHSLLINELQ